MVCKLAIILALVFVGTVAYAEDGVLYDWGKKDQIKEEQIDKDTSSDIDEADEEVTSLAASPNVAEMSIIGDRYFVCLSSATNRAGDVIIFTRTDSDITIKDVFVSSSLGLIVRRNGYTLNKLYEHH